MRSVILLLFCAYQCVYCLENGLVRTPPMGWISWTRFTCQIDCVKYPHNCINEQLYKDMADRMAADGYKDAGYEYINIDDCWSEMQRDNKTKRLVPNKQRFPSGMKALADYIHSKGLKFGIYGDVGPKTCAGYPSQNGPGAGFFDIDAQTFADWDVDSFKFDGCNQEPKDFDRLYPIMMNALNKTGRKIVYSCEWPLYQYFHNPRINPDYAAISKTCNLFRNYNDVYDSWSSIESIINFYGDNCKEFSKYNKPGSWFDPDMLDLGNFGLSYDESRVQMAMWALWSSPLYMSNDLREIKPEIKALLQNKKVIAVNQDPLGIMGQRVIKNGNFEAWSKKMSPTNGKFTYAVVFLNRNNLGDKTLYSVPVSSLTPTNGDKVTYIVHDLFGDGGDIIGKLNATQTLTLLVNNSGARMVKLVPISS